MLSKVGVLQIFWDLASLSEYEQDMCSELRITNDETIGRGGFGFVCEGELLEKVRSFLFSAYISR